MLQAIKYHEYYSYMTLFNKQKIAFKRKTSNIWRPKLSNFGFRMNKTKYSG